MIDKGGWGLIICVYMVAIILTVFLYKLLKKSNCCPSSELRNVKHFSISGFTITLVLIVIGLCYNV